MSIPQTEPVRQPVSVPALRLLRAPVSSPPYDDERPHGRGLRLVDSSETAARLAPVVPLPADLPAPPRLHAVPDVTPDERPPRTPSSQLPPARPFAHALVQRLLETSAGVRPVLQLQRDTTPELFAELERVLAVQPRHDGPRPTGRDVRSLHVQQPADGVAEVCATVRRAQRTRAVALRLEGQRGRWVCTDLIDV